VRNGITGEIARRPVTRQYQSVRSASASPTQNRRRDRRMYQLDRSSTKLSNARMTLTVRYAS
jgi:hypothetical protein